MSVLKSLECPECGNTLNIDVYRGGPHIYEPERRWIVLEEKYRCSMCSFTGYKREFTQNHFL